MNIEQQLVVLFTRLAVAAAVASLLARLGAFQRMLMREERTLTQRLRMAASLGVIFGAGSAARVLTGSYQALELGVPGCLLAGVLGGYMTGLVSGILVSIPAMLHREWLTMAMLAGIGLLGGLLRDLAPDTEEIWRVSPFYDLIAWFRVFRKATDRKRVAFQFLFVIAITFAHFVYESLYSIFGIKVLYPVHPIGFEPDPAWLIVLGYASTILAASVPLRIWNGARTEKKLEAQLRLLMEARLAALTSQINPHFLFNTLNSISSLVRVDPERARGVIYKLSSILRKLLRKQEGLTQLSDELAFIDDYLAIEIVRFGRKLRFERAIDDATLTCSVPSMMLQPIVENSIRHGLSSKVEGGVIRIRSWLDGERLHVAVEDDGVGIAEARLATLLDPEAGGIGVSNVNERLKVLFGADYRMTVESAPGEGTRTEIELPTAVSPAIFSHSTAR